MTITQTATLEKWESAIAGDLYINKFSPSGPPGTFIQEVVRGGRQFLITAEERNTLNSDRSHEHKDPFKNGMLRPVLAANIEAEAADIAQQLAMEAQRAAEPNPNHASDLDLVQLFRIEDHAVFVAEIGKITSAQTLQRLVTIAGSPAAAATVAQNNVVHEALTAVSNEGGPEVIEIEQSARIGAAIEDDRSGVHALKI